MDEGTGGSALDSILGLGREIVRLRYGRQPDPAQQGPQAIPVPAETAVQVRQPGASMAQYAPMILAAVAVVFIVGLALKKAG